MGLNELEVVAGVLGVDLEELLKQKSRHYAGGLSSRGWTRTNNRPINSRMLCH